MNDDRIIGELTEFKRVALKELEDIKKIELAAIRNDVKELMMFKWKATGIMAFLVTTVEMLHMAWDGLKQIK